MASPKDIDSASAAELALVDLLYDELDEEEAEAARERVEADDSLSAELSAFRDLRSLLSELPDEDPPAAVSAKLLHAAAERAPAKAKTDEETGFFAWFRRLFQPLMMHPALSAAATLVLVAGVAGALYVSGRVKFSEPTTSPATDSRVRGELHRDLPAATTPGAKRTAETPVSTESTLPTQQAAEPATKGGAVAPRPPADEPMKAPSTTARNRKKAGRAEAKPKSPDLGLMLDGESDDTAKDRGGESTGEEAQRELTEKAPADKKADNSRADDFGEAGGSVGTGNTIEVTPRNEPVLKKPAEEKSKEEERASRLTEVKKLHDRALRAAKDNECDAVISIGAQIRKLDPQYYKKSFLTDARLRSCRSTAPNAFE